MARSILSVMRLQSRVIAVALSLACMAAPSTATAKKKLAMILIYDGFGTPARARVWGRVVEDKGFDRPRKKERWTQRLKRSVRLLESDEIPHAELSLAVGKRVQRVKADHEGIFRVDLVGLAPGTHQVDAKLLGRTASKVRSFRSRIGRIYVAPKARKNSVAVISDIDDTVLDSGVTNKARLIKRLLFSNVHRMKSFAYAAALYRVFRARKMPIVFVSGSPINLQPRLTGFFALRGFPRAPLLLKNLGTSKGSDSLFKQRAYKLKRIKEAMALLPGYRLLLIGDSGEKDPEIYRAVSKLPGAKVVATLIHAIGKSKANDARFAGQVLFRSYLVAAQTLAKRGLVSSAQVKKLRQQKGLQQKGHR
jgi:phosphatidate phosphatase APP1